MSMLALRSGDLAHRVAYRRHELGLTFEEVADRAGMDPGYLDYLEHSSDVAITRGTLSRLAAALETTVAYLRGGEIDRPPGPGRAGPHPHLDILSREECEAHLAGGGVGRFVFLAEQGPVALPVNFRVADGDIVFRTRSGGALAAAAGTTVSFEADHIDEAMSEGWSVLITGRARLIDEPAELEKVIDLGDLEPWPGGRREALMRIETATISGRRIRQGSVP
jgi:nitroimidazol reductase NimA-like FMN-containing flavoprotein (pyridoxamine 5'-phosphate oxidase superfamily)